MTTLFLYKPLPDIVFLQESDIDGLGLFARDSIQPNTCIGITHKKEPGCPFPNGLIRTPLGGFINHSENPNCFILTTSEYWELYTTHVVMPLEELTVDYRLYL